MTNKVLYLIIILILIIGGILAYISFGPEKEAEEISPPEEKEFDFQVVLPRECNLQLEDFVGAADSIQGEKVEEVSVNKNGKFNLKEFYLPEGTERGVMAIHKTGLFLKVPLFEQELAKQVLDQESLNFIDPYLWPSEAPVEINVKSTAIGGVVENLLFELQIQGIVPPDASQPEITKKIIKILPLVLTNSKLTDYQNEIKKALISERGKEEYTFDIVLGSPTLSQIIEEVINQTQTTGE